MNLREPGLNINSGMNLSSSSAHAAQTFKRHPGDVPEMYLWDVSRMFFEHLCGMTDYRASFSNLPPMREEGKLEL